MVGVHRPLPQSLPLFSDCQPPIPTVRRVADPYAAACMAATINGRHVVALRHTLLPHWWNRD